MVERTVVVQSKLGLHARAAAKLVRVATKFRSRVTVGRLDSNASADAKSILSILMLAASRGTELRLTADGVDEQEALASMIELFREGFGELEPELTKQ